MRSNIKLLTSLGCFRHFFCWIRRTQRSIKLSTSLREKECILTRQGKEACYRAWNEFALFIHRGSPHRFTRLSSLSFFSSKIPFLSVLIDSGPSFSLIQLLSQVHSRVSLVLLRSQFVLVDCTVLKSIEDQ